MELIRYLFKDYAFKDESEFRILQIVKNNDQKIKYCANANNVFITFRQVNNLVDEVILGTNYENQKTKNRIEVFRHHLHRKDKDNLSQINIVHSSLPITP